MVTTSEELEVGRRVGGCDKTPETQREKRQHRKKAVLCGRG
jgi:hypothetical protein